MDSYPVHTPNVELPHHTHSIECSVGPEIAIPKESAAHHMAEHAAHKYEGAYQSNVKESIMSDSEKVDVHNIFKPGGHGGDGMGGLGTAATIMAMGNRNEGAGLAALAPALFAGRPHDGMFGAGGFGAGLVGGLLGGALFGNRRGGLFGGGDCDGNGGAETRIEDTVFNTAVLNKLGSIEAAIPLASAQTENVILQQTNQITNLASQAQLANAAGFANTKDAIQNSNVILLQGLNSVNSNVSAQGCETREAVAAAKTEILAAIKQSEIDELRARVARSEREVEIQSMRSQIEVNQTVNQQQAQGQQQTQVQLQFQNVDALLRRLFDRIEVVHQEARATNSNVIAGNTGAVVTGAQAANPTNVNA